MLWCGGETLCCVDLGEVGGGGVWEIFVFRAAMLLCVRNICFPCGHVIVREVIFVFRAAMLLCVRNIYFPCGHAVVRYRSMPTCLSGACRA